MDLDIVGKVLLCKNELELKAEFNKILNQIGIHSFAYMEISQCENISPKIISNFSQGWLERYVECSYKSVDKTVELCGVSTSPFTWENTRRILQQDNIQKTYWAEANLFNLKEGITVPIENLKKITGFGYALDKNENSNLWLNEFQSTIVILSVVFHQQLNRLAETSNSIAVLSRITARELECAQWLSVGLTAINVAKKMKITERTVRFHLNQLKYKLNVKTKEEVLTLLAFHRLIDL
jgi:LuxR family quorum-sensing transcriptional regulator LasR